ncbi:MAG: hypothetical protein ACLS3V_00945 [Streptococcus sp.]
MRVTTSKSGYFLGFDNTAFYQLMLAKVDWTFDNSTDHPFTSTHWIASDYGTSDFQNL